jgi:hypothetical protein
MNRRTTVLLAAALIGWSTPAFAQVPDWVNQVLTAAQLPVAATEARREGIADTELRKVLDALFNAGVPAHDATALIETERQAHRENGPTDNFGAFVQAQLAAGKRGQELAAAIRAEHARQGKGNAAKKAKGQDSDDREKDEKPDNRGRRRPQSR